ncbi:hypothetical protein DMENIID0001_145270 [Sergentomyia squamirostris]
MKFFPLVLLVLQLVSVNYGFSEEIFNKLHREPRPTPTRKINSRNIKEQWIEQYLDHFNSSNSETWKMRYFSNYEFYKKLGPLFIFVGGEWEITKNWIAEGHMYDMAKELNGALFYTEHRFYGKSRPTNDLSVENLKYLSSEQAIEDLDVFIVNLFETHGYESSVFLVGCSYSGSLVTWYSSNYPYIVHGAWASSAPIVAITDFQEYYQVAAASINLINSTCYVHMDLAFEEIQNLIKNKNSNVLKSKLNLCSSLNVDIEMNVWLFYKQIVNRIGSDVRSLGLVGIEEMCDHVVNYNNPLTGLAAYFKNRSSNCINVDFKSAIEPLKNTSWSENTNMRQWFFQLCNEFGWFQTSYSTFFTAVIPVDFYITMCKEIFRKDFTFEIGTINYKVCLTNQKYGGLRPSVDKVYSTHGELDPWKAAGTPRDLNPQSPTTLLPMESHCSDLQSIQIYDSQYLKDSKNRIKELVKQWNLESKV